MDINEIIFLICFIGMLLHLIVAYYLQARRNRLHEYRWNYDYW